MSACCTPRDIDDVFSEKHAEAKALILPRRSKFRAFVHPASRIIATATSEGLRLERRRRGLLWQMLVFARETADQTATTSGGTQGGRA